MNSALSPSRHRLKTLLAILIAGGFFFALWSMDAFEGSESRVRDIYVDVLSGSVESNLLIVEIDAASIEKVGQWPWPRHLYASAIEQLTQAGIRSLMIDVDFSARSQPHNDAVLAEALVALAQQTPVRLPVFVQNRRLNDKTLVLRRPLSAIGDNADPVSVNMQPESDGLVRFLGLGFQWQDQFYPSAWNRIAGHTRHSTWIDYSISPESFRYVSFNDLMTGRVPDDVLEGRDVLLGSTAIELGDNLAVPIYQVLPGVVIQALGAETLRRGGLFRVSAGAGAVLLVIFWLLAGAVSMRLNWRRGLQTLTGVALVYTAAVISSYHYAHLIIDLVAPLAVCTFVYIAVNLTRLDTESLQRLWLQVTLRDSQALHDRIVATANDCIVCVDRDGVITRANPAIQRLCGEPEPSLLGSLLADRFPDAKRGLAMLPAKPFDTTIIDSDGQHIPVEATISPLELSSAPIYTVVLRDLSERVAREQQLRYQASHDELTGLLNRTAFFRCVSDALNKRAVGCVLTLNLDYFREVNDAYGHKAGDRLLKVVAARIEKQVASPGCAARIGADGFALWLPGLRFAGGGGEFCQYLLKSLEATVTLTEPYVATDAKAEPGDTIELQIFATIGVAEIDGTPAGRSEPDEGQAITESLIGRSVLPTAEALLGHSADAMRLAKAAGVAFRCYSNDDGQAATRRLELVPAIRANIRDNAFHLVYQPKLALETAHPVGCEVLLRWPLDRGEVIPVGTFIEVAENSRQIAPLTRWVVEALLRQEPEWQARGLPRQIAINMSARLFQDHQFIAGLKDLLQSSIGYYQFEFEITETALMGNAQRAITLVNDLLDSGGTLSIDDYGTGYSSLSYLQELNASVLKIDRSFVTDIQQHPANQVIVQSTVKMAHELGMRVVAEGVETAHDEQFLRGINCDYVQGYYYAKPLAIDDFEQWLAQWANRSRPAPGAPAGKPRVTTSFHHYASASAPTQSGQ